MGKRQRRIIAGVAASLAIAIAGCSSSSYDGPARAEVSGSVTFKGSPVQQGSISLSPVGHDGRASGGSIQDGKYLITEDQGPNEGKYRVEIFVFEPPAKAAAEGSDAGMNQVAPPKFNRDSTLELDVSGTKVEKNFELTP